jgi:sulfite reductase beta subunit-like hemoprotein
LLCPLTDIDLKILKEEVKEMINLIFNLAENKKMILLNIETAEEETVREIGNRLNAEEDA